jgi:hypothetical protein
MLRIEATIPRIPMSVTSPRFSELGATERKNLSTQSRIGAKSHTYPGTEYVSDNCADVGLRGKLWECAAIYSVMNLKSPVHIEPLWCCIGSNVSGSPMVHTCGLL